MLKIKPIYLVIFTLVIVYLATTGIGAASFATQFGRDQLAAFLFWQEIPNSLAETTTTALYWALLASLIVITPVFALATEAIAGRIIAVKEQTIPTWIPVSIAAIMVSFCFYKLANAGGLAAIEMWDHTVCFAQKMVRRAELIQLLGNRYYAFCYSSLPTISALLLAKFILKRDRLALIGFIVLSIAIVWLDVAMIMKAPVVIYLGIVALTMIICGVGIFRTAVFAVPIIACVYFALSIMQFCDPAHQAQTPLPPSVVASHTDLNPFVPVLMIAPPDDNPLIHATRSAALRMASSFPFYVQTYSDTDARCGIGVPHLINQKCYPPGDIFQRMYPAITYTIGSAPAPISVAAFAAAGWWYVILATALCGIVIGIVSFISRGSTPLSVAARVAACIYAYYVCQTSFIGSLIDSYGLFWLLFPLVICVGMARIMPSQHPIDNHDSGGTVATSASG